MPARRKGSNFGHRTNRSTDMRNRRAQRTDEQIQQYNERVRVNMAQLRESKSQEERAEQNKQRRLKQRQARRFVVDTRRSNEQQRQQVHREFSSDLPGMPPHYLQLKVGSPVLLRNLNPPRLCNGTRLVIKKLMKNVIEASILNGKFRGVDVLLPPIPFIPTDVSIEFKRVQFPIRLAFAMTIIKSQGQTMSVCGLDLGTPCFSHGQLYVACFRVGKPSNLFVLAKDGYTKNIVHSIALID